MLSLNPRLFFAPFFLKNPGLGGGTLHHLVIQDGSLHLHGFPIDPGEAKNHRAGHREEAHTIDAHFPQKWEATWSNHGGSRKRALLWEGFLMIFMGVFEDLSGNWMETGILWDGFQGVWDADIRTAHLSLQAQTIKDADHSWWSSSDRKRVRNGNSMLIPVANLYRILSINYDLCPKTWWVKHHFASILLIFVGISLRQFM